MRCDKFKHGRENGQPEDGEDDGQPDGDGVHDDTEAGEKHHEAHSRQTVARRRRFGAVEDVETQRERQVGGHRESVGHGQPGQDAVGRRDHVAARQHDDVERVGDDAQRAYDRRQVAVVVLVGERGQRIRFDLSVRRPSSWKVAVVVLVEECGQRTFRPFCPTAEQREASRGSAGTSRGRQPARGRPGTRRRRRPPPPPPPASRRRHPAECRRTRIRSRSTTSCCSASAAHVVT